MNTHLRVAVCTNRDPDAVAESLEALQRQVPADRLVLVLSGVGGDGYEAPNVVFEPAGGLSRARNRALEWAAAADVLAFVDDDAVVGDGWYDALTRRWDEAPADVACIGGAIRPRLSVPPPSRRSDGLYDGLCLLHTG